MLVLILSGLAVSLALLEEPAAEQLLPAGWTTVPVLAGYLALAALLAWGTSALSLRVLTRRAVISASVLRRHAALTFLTRLWLIGGSALVLLLGFGRWIIDDLDLGRFPLASEAMALLPFVAALILVWLLDYPYYRMVRLRLAEQYALTGQEPITIWSRRDYLVHNLRHHLLFVLVPVGLIVLAVDALHLYLGPLLPAELAEPVLLVGSGLLAGLVFLLAPLLIVRIWATSRLPDGPLRTELNEMCRALKLRYRDLLIWRTGNAIANAAMMGLIAPVRYVLLSDGLLEKMDRRQTKAVFAHEAGHIVQHHIFYSALFAVAAALLAGSLASLLEHSAARGPWQANLLAAALLLLAWWAGFGWLSRRFERQSDVLAAQWVGREFAPPGQEHRITPQGAAIFAAALQRIAQLNGISPRQRNWRHGSIAGRVGFVLWMGARGESTEVINRVIRRCKIALWMAFGISVALASFVLLAETAPGTT